MQLFVVGMYIASFALLPCLFGAGELVLIFKLMVAGKVATNWDLKFQEKILFVDKLKVKTRGLRTSDSSFWNSGALLVQKRKARLIATVLKCEATLPWNLLSSSQVLVPQIDLVKEQVFDIRNLKQSCQQAEDALSQGMEKLKQILAEAVASGQLGGGNYIPQMTMEKLESLVRFVLQVMILLLIECSVGFIYRYT